MMNAKVSQNASFISSAFHSYCLPLFNIYGYYRFSFFSLVSLLNAGALEYVWDDEVSFIFSLRDDPENTDPGR